VLSTSAEHPSYHTGFYRHPREQARPTAYSFKSDANRSRVLVCSHGPVQTRIAAGFNRGRRRRDEYVLMSTGLLTLIASELGKVRRSRGAIRFERDDSTQLSKVMRPRGARGERARSSERARNG
jgi:hypothetical protein